MPKTTDPPESSWRISARTSRNLATVAGRTPIFATEESPVPIPSLNLPGPNSLRELAKHARVKGWRVTGLVTLVYSSIAVVTPRAFAIVM